MLNENSGVASENENHDVDLFETPEFFQAFKAMEERLEIRLREFQIEEDNAKIFASQIVLR